MSTNWVEHPCDSGDCEVTTHLFPKAGTFVQVIETVSARGIGEETEHIIEAGTVGIVSGYVPEWFDVDVWFGEGPLEAIWISPDNLREVPNV